LCCNKESINEPPTGQIIGLQAVFYLVINPNLIIWGDLQYQGGEGGDEKYFLNQQDGGHRGNITLSKSKKQGRG
jgi:hypothetical protein